MEDIKLKKYIYPDGTAVSMNKDEIVLRVTASGSFEDTYAGELIEGDEYCERYQHTLPPRPADKLLDFIGRKRLNINFTERSDGSVSVDIGDNLTTLVRYPYDEKRNSLREGIEYIMDQEEL